MTVVRDGDEGSSSNSIRGMTQLCWLALGGARPADRPRTIRAVSFSLVRSFSTGNHAKPIGTTAYGRADASKNAGVMGAHAPSRVPTGALAGRVGRARDCGRTSRPPCFPRGRGKPHARARALHPVLMRRPWGCILTLFLIANGSGARRLRRFAVRKPAGQPILTRPLGR